jgi:hypothetical protein
MSEGHSVSLIHQMSEGHSDSLIHQMSEGRADTVWWDNQFKRLQTKGFKITAAHTYEGFSSPTDYLASSSRKLWKKANYTIDLYLGQYVQVHHPNVNNSMDARTSGAIALMSTNNSRGTVVFYDLKTRVRVTLTLVDQWINLCQRILNDATLTG